jgi:RNA 3'-terminal phosphate cyclase (ATP)
VPVWCRPRRSARTDVGSYRRVVARTFLADLRSGATVDRHLADQLVLFAALAHGRSGCIVPEVTDHVVSNVWLVRQFGATVSMASNSVTVDGINLKRSVVA